MDVFSYLTTFIGLIPALALARVLGGLADLVQHHLDPGPGRVKWSALFVGWSVLLLLGIAHDWWVTFGWAREAGYNYWLFAFLLLKPSIYLFMARLLMPDVKAGEEVDLEARYFHVYRWTTSLFVVLILLDIPDTLLHGVESYQKLGGARYLAAILAMAAFSLTLLLTRRRGYHLFVMGAWLAILVATQLVFGIETIR